MRYFKFAIVVITLACFLCGCGSDKDESLAVAKDFWKAMKDRDIEKAKTYATSASADALTINAEENDQDVEISFGDIEIKDGKSTIETNMQAVDDDSQMTIPMETVLIKEEGEWKVDVNLTMMSLFGGAMGAMMESMKEGMEELGKSMAEEMKASMEELSQGLSTDDGN
jgi:hypothetical protein